jgi:hypothetical protein
MLMILSGMDFFLVLILAMFEKLCLRNRGGRWDKRGFAFALGLKRCGSHSLILNFHFNG